MNEYTVYFEIFGKKMQTKIIANSELEAKNKVKEKIIFHRIKKEDNIRDIMDLFGGIFK